MYDFALNSEFIRIRLAVASVLLRCTSYSSPILSRLKPVSSPSVARYYIGHQSDNKRTTNGQQSNNNWT